MAWTPHLCGLSGRLVTRAGEHSDSGLDSVLLTKVQTTSSHLSTHRVNSYSLGRGCAVRSIDRLPARVIPGFDLDERSQEVPI